MPTYTLRHLEYLVACADHGSIAQAAMALNVSQPTVSVAIAKLEDQFGLQLLMRHHGQGMTATVGAQRVLHASRQLLAQARDLSDLAKETSQSVNGDLRIGAFSAMAPTILPELVSELQSSFPGIRLQFREGTQIELITKLRNGELTAITDNERDENGVLKNQLAKVEIDLAGVLGGQYGLGKKTFSLGGVGSAELRTISYLLDARLNVSQQVNTKPISKLVRYDFTDAFGNPALAQAYVNGTLTQWTHIEVDPQDRVTLLTDMA